MGTIAETLIAEGEARGKRQGIVEGKPISLIQFLERRFGPLSERSKATIMGANVSEVDAWIDGVFEAQSAQALLGDIHCSAIFTACTSRIFLQRPPKKSEVMF